MTETFDFIPAAAALLMLSLAVVASRALWRTKVTHAYVERHLAAIQKHLTHWTPPR